MAIQTPQGFVVRSPEAIDDRLILNKKQMEYLSRPGQNGQLPPVYICVCRDDGQVYVYDKERNNWDNETGYYALYTPNTAFPGAGNGIDPAALADVANPLIQVLVNNSEFVFEANGALKISPELLEKMTGADAKIEREIQRAKDSEGMLTVQLNNEIQRALGAERDLNTDLSDKIQQALDAVTAEQTRAGTEEAKIDAKIDAEKTRAETAEATLQANINTKQKLLTAGNAINLVSGTASDTISVKYDDDTIKLNASGQLKANFDNQTIKLNSGSYGVNVDNQTIGKNSANALEVKLSGNSMTKDASGIKVNLDEQSLDIVSNKVALKKDPSQNTISVSGSGVKLNTNETLLTNGTDGLRVNFAKVQKKLVTDPGLRITSEGDKERIAVLYDGLLPGNNSETIDIDANGYLYAKDVWYAGLGSAKGTLKQIIPASAGTDRISQPGVKNDLVTYDQLMDAISSNLGEFRGTFDSEGALEAAYPYGSANRNDYAFVTNVSSEGTYYDRYKCTNTPGSDNWIYEFRIATTGFTADQWKSLESMATKEDLEDLKAHIENVVPGTATSTKEAYKVTYDTQGHMTSKEVYHADWEQDDQTKSDFIKHRPAIRRDPSSPSDGIDSNVGTIIGGIALSATGSGALAQGAFATASGNNSHAEGEHTTASGDSAHAEGKGSLNGLTWTNVIASGLGAHAEGIGTNAAGQGSHAEGRSTNAFANYSHAEGHGGNADAEAAHAEGAITMALGDYSHAEGHGSNATAEASHAEGYNTMASGLHSHAEGHITSAIGDYSHAEGFSTGNSTSEGAHGEASHVEGIVTYASGEASHAEGARTIASGHIAHAEGFWTIASGDCSHAEGVGEGGYEVTASGVGAHAEGGVSYGEFPQPTRAAGNYSHAEGEGSRAIGEAAHAEGINTYAEGASSHAEGGGTQAYGVNSHTEGSRTSAVGANSHAEGYNTRATIDHQHVQGKFNVEDTEGLYADIVGWGEESRANISSLTTDGDLHILQDFYFQSDADGKNGYKLPYDIVQKTGTTETGLVARRDTIYIYGTLTSLKVTSFDPNGICDIIFTSGATATTVTLPTGVKLPTGFAWEANKTYEINVLNNLALVGTWE